MKLLYHPKYNSHAVTDGQQVCQTKLGKGWVESEGEPTCLLCQLALSKRKVIKNPRKNHKWFAEQLAKLHRPFTRNEAFAMYEGESEFKSVWYSIQARGWIKLKQIDLKQRERTLWETV